MMRLVIHAGPRKTATTSFQRGCDAARSAGVLRKFFTLSCLLMV